MSDVVRTLSLLIGANDAGLGTTLYRASKSIDTFQHKAISGNVAVARSRLESLELQKAAQLSEVSSSIAQYGKRQLAAFESENAITANLEKESAKRAALSNSNNLRDVAKTTTASLSTSSTGTTALKTAEITAARDLELASISETYKARTLAAANSNKTILAESLARYKAEEANAIANIETVAARESAAIAATTEKRLAAAERVNAKEINKLNNSGTGNAGADAARRVALDKQQAERLTAIKAEEAAQLQLVASTAGAEKEQALSTAKFKTKAVEDALAKQLADTERALQVEKTARIAATTQTAEQEILIHKKKNAVKLESDLKAVAKARDLGIANELSTLEASTAGATAKQTVSNNNAQRNVADSLAVQRAAAQAQIEADYATNERLAKDEIRYTEQRATAYKFLRNVLLGVGLATLATLAVGAKQGIDLERSVRNIAAISPELQGSEVKIKAVGDELLRLSTILPTTGKDLAEGLYQVVSSGFTDSLSSSLKVLTGSAVAATAGLSTTKEAADGITSVLIALESLGTNSADKAVNVSRVSDVLFQTVNIGKVTFKELSGSLGKVLGLANSLGVSVEQIGAAFSTITLSGLSAAETETALARILTSFQKPTKDLSALVRKWGYESGEAAIKSLGLYGVINKVKEATGNSSTAFATMFRDVRAANGALALVANGGATYANGMDKIGKANASAGATMRALAEQSKGLGQQLTILKNKAAAESIKAVTPILEYLNKNLPAIEAFAAASVGTIKKVANDIAPTFNALLSTGKNLFDIAVSIGKTLGPFLATSLGIGLTVIQGIASGLQYITRVLSQNSTVLTVIAGVVGGALTLAFLNFAKGQVILSISNLARGLTSLATGLGALGPAAAGTSSVLTTVAAGVTTTTTTTIAASGAMTGFGASLSAIKVALSTIVTPLALVTSALLAVKAAYDLVTYAATSSAEAIEGKATKANKSRVDTILADQDLKTVTGIIKAREALAARQIKLANDIKNADVQALADSSYKNLSYGGKVAANFGGIFGDTVKDDVRTSLKVIGKTAEAEFQKSSDTLNASLIVAKANVSDVQGQLSKNLKPGETVASLKTIEYAAKTLGVDLTKTFSGNEIERDKLVSYFRNNLSSAIEGVATEAEILALRATEAFDEMDKAAKKAGESVAESFAKAFSTVDNFKLTDTTKAEDAVLAGQKKIEALEKKKKAIEDKIANNGLTVKDTDKATDAATKAARANEDLATSYSKVSEGERAYSSALSKGPSKTDGLRDQLEALAKSKLDLIAGGASKDIIARYTAQENTVNAQLLATQDKENNNLIANTSKRTKAQRRKADADLKVSRVTRDNSNKKTTPQDTATLKLITKELESEKAKQNIKVADAERTKNPADAFRNQLEKDAAAAKKASEDLSNIIKKGASTELVSTILAKGFKDNATLVALAGDNTGELVKLANTSYSKLSIVGQRAGKIADINSRAQSYLADGNNKLAEQADKARLIQTTIDDFLANGVSPKDITVDVLSKKTGIAADKIKELSTAFQINQPRADGLTVLLSEVEKFDTTVKLKTESVTDSYKQMVADIQPEYQKLSSFFQLDTATLFNKIDSKDLDDKIKKKQSELEAAKKPDLSTTLVPARKYQLQKESDKKASKLEKELAGLVTERVNISQKVRPQQKYAPLLIGPRITEVPKSQRLSNVNNDSSVNIAKFSVVVPDATPEEGVLYAQTIARRKALTRGN